MSTDPSPIGQEMGLRLATLWGTTRARPAPGATFEALLWPALATLLYAAFAQAPLLNVRDAFGDRRLVLTM